MHLVVAERLSQAIPVLYSFRGADVFNNALGCTQIDARLSVRSCRSLVGREVRLVCRAVDICPIITGSTIQQMNTHKVDGTMKLPSEQFSGLEEKVPRTSIASCTSSM